MKDVYAKDSLIRFGNAEPLRGIGAITEVC
jgi:hypothetical protein